MDKIQKNITAIESKFQSLKAAYQLYKQPSPISQVVEVITDGIMKEDDVEKYLSFIHSSSDIKLKEKINEQWFDLGMPQMIQFMQKVIRYNSKQKAKQLTSNQKLNLSPEKKKFKKPINETHQNPFIPAKIQSSSKFKMNNAVNQQINQKELHINYSLQQIQNNKIPDIIDQEKYNSLVDSKSTNDQYAIELPFNFEGLPVKQKYAILSKKYGKNKTILEKKFDTIYKHYRKQMYIPFQSFQINNELLMDLKIFLKYYREFQLSKKFKTNQAITNFKKLALNGLWLEDKNFFDIHYKLIEILDIDQKLFNQLLSKNNSLDVDKQNELKNKISENIKILINNIEKLNELSSLISNNKMKEVFNNNNNRNAVTKIIEAHSGLYKQDVILKLKQRNQERKNNKNYLIGAYNLQKLNKLSPVKLTSPSKLQEDKTVRSSPHQLSIYDQLSIPKLRSRQMKKSSVYSSLQILNIHKQKERLKELINENDNEQYLEAYFRKQKQFYSLVRSNSINLTRNLSQNQESSTNNFSIKSNKQIKGFNRENLFKRNLSLPRMKFT